MWNEIKYHWLKIDFKSKKSQENVEINLMKIRSFQVSLIGCISASHSRSIELGLTQDGNQLKE